MRRVLRFVAAIALLFTAAQANAAGGFSDWAAIVVAGDNHAHDGSLSEVFDNGRRDIANDLLALGFSRDNIVQFSVNPAAHPGTQSSDPGTISAALWDLSSRTSAGCFIYLTSHGSPQGIVIADNEWAPSKFARAVDNACGGRPTVVMVSACFSGIFVGPLASPERLVVTAARPDRTSFGCGSTDRYTFFDQCVLQSFSGAGDFSGLANSARACVASREKAMNVGPPSEPQIALGNTAAAQLPHWR